MWMDIPISCLHQILFSQRASRQKSFHIVDLWPHISFFLSFVVTNFFLLFCFKHISTFLSPQRMNSIFNLMTFQYQRNSNLSPHFISYYLFLNHCRLKVENAALQESMANLEHLTSAVHRLRVTLLKVRFLNTILKISSGLPLCQRKGQQCGVAFCVMDPEFVGDWLVQ